MKSILTVLMALGLVASAEAKVVTQTIEYKDGDVVCEGYLAYDDAAGTAKRPGVLVVHEWMGLGKNVKTRCEMLAGLGYVAFGADIYGKGVRPANAQEAGAEAGKYKGNSALTRHRANLALEQLRANGMVDTSKVAAIGYCFGGWVCLELARSGAPVNGVVGFHSSLDSPNPADAKNIKGKVLILNGGDDPFVGKEAVEAFEKEMRDANVDWQFVAYGGAVHSYTNPDAGNDNSKGAAYNAKADRRSWQAMQDFFGEIFK